MFGFVHLFLATAMINSTLNSCKDSDFKNLKLLKTYLGNLTLTVIYLQNAFRTRIVSNLLLPVKAVLGDFSLRCGIKTQSTLVKVDLANRVRSKG